MAIIELGNVHSRVVPVSPEGIEKVQYHVAFQEDVLPPKPVQAEIRSYFRQDHVFRKGGMADVLAVQAQRHIVALMEDCGFDPADMTIRMLANTLKQRNVWSGWRSLVNDAGFFPTGVAHLVERALVLRVGEDVHYIDNRGPRPEPEPGIVACPPLLPFQAEAVEAFLRGGRGVWDLPPRAGKTRAAMAAIARIGRPAIFVVPTVGLVTQTVAAFHEFYPENMVIGVSGGAASLSAKRQRQLLHALVIVATPATASALPVLRTRQVLIIDEFHHAAADTWQKVSVNCPAAWWRLGMTGTHFRSDGRDMEMAGVLGQVLYSRSVSDMVALGRLVPARIAMLRVFGGSWDGRQWYKDSVVWHGPRNQTVVWATIQLLERGFRPLVLAQEVEHVHVLASQIPGAVGVDGSDHDAVNAAIRGLGDGSVRCIVGTSVLGEGRDVPTADALVYAAGGKSPVKVTQDTFRPLTASPGKRFAVIVDFADNQGSNVVDHATRRLLLYRDETAFTTDVMEWTAFSAWLDRQGGSVP